MADLVDFLFDCKAIEGCERQAQEKTDTTIQRKESIAKRPIDLLRRSLNGRWVGNSPVRSHRLTWPDGTNLVGGVVTYGKNKIELGSPGLGKFAPVLASQVGGGKMRCLKLRQGFRSHRSRWMTARTVSSEVSLALVVHYRFSHDRAGRVPCAQEQNVVAPFHLKVPQLQQVGLQQDSAFGGFTARTNALMNFPSTCGAIASTSMFWPERNSR